MSTTTFLQTILLMVVGGGIVWWWKKGFQLPTFGNPLAGGAVTTTLQSVFSVQMIAVTAAFAALEFALWNSGWLPKMFGLPGILQIPTYGVLIFITNLVEEKTTGKLKTGARFMMIVAFTIFGLGHLNFDKVAVWWNTSSSTVQTARTVQTVRQSSPDPCDNMYRKYNLTQEPVRIVAAEGCKMGWDVLQGEVVLIGPGGVKSRPITSANPLPGFHGVKWRSNGDTALVEARFYR